MLQVRARSCPLALAAGTPPRRAGCPNPRFWIVPSRPAHGLVLPEDDGQISMVPEAVMVGSDRLFCPGVIEQRRPLLAPRRVVHSADLCPPL